METPQPLNLIDIEVMTSVNFTIPVKDSIPGLAFDAQFEMHVGTDDSDTSTYPEIIEYLNVVYLGKEIRAGEFSELLAKNMDTLGININKMMEKASMDKFKELFPDQRLQKYILAKTKDIAYNPDIKQFTIIQRA